MRKWKQQNYTIDALFIIILFAAFCICTLSVVVVGANVYNTITQNTNDNFTTKTALSYLVEKVRQNDSGGTLKVQKWHGSDTLIFHQKNRGITYITYIYFHEGTLKELVVKEGTPCFPEDGQTIMAIQNFQIEQKNSRLYHIIITGENGCSDFVSVAERSLQ